MPAVHHETMQSLSERLHSLAVTGQSSKDTIHRSSDEISDEEIPPRRERLDSASSESSLTPSTDSGLSDESDEDRVMDPETMQALRKYSQRMVYLTRRQFEAFCRDLERRKRVATTSHSTKTRRAQSGF